MQQFCNLCDWLDDNLNVQFAVGKKMFYKKFSKTLVRSIKMKKTNSMKKTIFLVFLTVLIVSLMAGSCTTYEVKDRTEVVSKEVVRVDESNRPEFSCSDTALKLEYKSSFYEQERETIEERRETYETRSGKTIIIDTEVIETYKQNGRRSNQKSQTLIPAAGTKVKIIINWKTIDAVTNETGSVAFTDELSSVILSAAKDISSFDEVKVDIPDLKMHQTGRYVGAPTVMSAMVNIKSAAFVTKAISETQERISSINKAVVTNPSTYETYAKSLVSLKKEMQYPFQTVLLVSELESIRKDLLEKINADRAPILDKFPEFWISGTINNYMEGTEATTFEIWGTATPVPLTEVAMRSLGSRGKPSYLWVIVKNSTIKNSNIVSWWGNKILIQGRVRYVKQYTSKNISGETVLVFEYTENTKDIPGFAGDQEKKLQTLNSQTDTINNLYSQYSKMLKG